MTENLFLVAVLFGLSVAGFNADIKRFHGQCL
jgi:hypothetical protein